jgi:hypothetical protein
MNKILQKMVVVEGEGEGEGAFHRVFIVISER